MKFLNILKLPETRQIQNLDSPITTVLHAKIIQQKPFLKNVYVDFYTQFKNAIPVNKKKKFLVELGSGGGFIKEIIPNITTSDLLKLSSVDVQLSALSMPFKNESVDIFFMADVFHHIPNVSLFFREVDRTLKKHGKLIMIEPANTLWGRFIYSHFHHEPFDPKGSWTLKKTGRLSGANGALPFIVFIRDRKKFKKLFPHLRIARIEPHTPLRYIISGGLTFKQLLPSISYSLVVLIERTLSPFNKYVGMFYTIELQKM